MFLCFSLQSCVSLGEPERGATGRAGSDCTWRPPKPARLRTSPDLSQPFHPRACIPHRPGLRETWFILLTSVTYRVALGTLREGVQVGLGGVLRELGCSPGTLIPRAQAAVTPAQTRKHGEWHHCPLHGGSPGRGLTSQQKSQLGEVSKGTTNACDKLQ